MQNFNRRDFLKVSALASGGLLISSVPSFGHSIKKRKALAPISLNPLLRIGSDNSITVILSKVEMGQGISTTLPMLLAEELDCEWKKIRVEHEGPGTKDDDFYQPVMRSTGGSESTVATFDQYRLAGATAREILKQTAAQKFNIDPGSCTTENGFVIAGSQRIAYGELAQQASLLPVPEVKLRDSRQWRIIGRSQNRIDLPEKINGVLTYGMDIHFPGLLVAVVAHPPAFGAQVRSFDDTAARALPGVHDVIRIPSGVAVLAGNFWTAKTGRDALKIEWDHTSANTITSQEQYNEYSRLAGEKGSTVAEQGDVIAALKNADKTLEAEFTFPYLAHAPMEPLNCTVRLGDDTCEVWCATQSPLLHQAEIATFLGMKPEHVKLYTPAMGGSFGRRGSFAGDWVIEAVTIAKISGKPVKLIWSREDDITGGYYRPVYTHKVAVGIASGYPVAWQHRIVGQPLFVNTPLEEMIVVKGIDYSLVTDGSPYTASMPDFSFELKITSNRIPVLPWRSVGNTHTAYAMETLVDALATSASMDPVAYRRKLYQHSPRHLAALELAADKAQWSVKLPADRYRGIAVHAAMGSYVAHVVEISVKNNKIKIERVVCAIDCGLAVNPDGVRAQMEGGIVFGLTAAIYGEITFEKGRVKQSNFHDYKMLRMSQCPHIEVHIVDSSEKMGGAGEPGVPPVAPALANALSSATGKRYEKLPLRPEGLSF